MRRASALVGTALLLVAGGCLGSSSEHGHGDRRGPRTATEPSRTISRSAELTVRTVRLSCGRDTSSGSGICRTHFPLRCLPERTYMQLAGVVPNERLCLAILDFRDRSRATGSDVAPILCACPAPTPVLVEIRGTVRGERVFERITSCGCGEGPRARHDAMVILERTRERGSRRG